MKIMFRKTNRNTTKNLMSRRDPQFLRDFGNLVRSINEIAVDTRTQSQALGHHDDVKNGIKAIIQGRRNALRSMHEYDDRRTPKDPVFPLKRKFVIRTKIIHHGLQVTEFWGGL